MKRGKTLENNEEGGKLLTSRGNPNDQNAGDAAGANQPSISPLKTRSIRNPDFIR